MTSRRGPSRPPGQSALRRQRRTGDNSSNIPKCGSSASPRPNHLHVELARAAAEAGKHIFCEKPVGRNPEETAEIEAAARQAGVLSFVGFNYRWAPLVVHTRKLIAEGKLGEINHYRGRFLSMYGSNPRSRLTWRFDRDLAGFGAVIDLMSHVVEMAHSLIGPVKRVVANHDTFIKQRPLPTPGVGTHFSLGDADDPAGEVTNEDYVGALVEFANGAQGTFEVSRAIFGPKCEMAFELNGAKGAAGWNFERLNELDLYLPGEDGLHDGYIKLIAGDQYPYHGNFNPGDGSGIGYEDLKTIEAYEFSTLGRRRRARQARFRRCAGGSRGQRRHGTVVGKRGLGRRDEPPCVITSWTEESF